MRSAEKLALATALVVVCLSGSSTAARTAGQQSKETAPQAVAGPNPETRSGPRSQKSKSCPSQNEIDAALSAASILMGQAKYQDAAKALQPLSGFSCDARVSLLLAAAFEGNGDSPRAQQVLQQAHSVWPSNNSIATSLAREYLAERQIEKAVQALGSFHATPATPRQEMELAAVAFLAGHRLASAHEVAEIAYRTYPSVHSLLLLANTLQLEGRFKEVIQLLGDQRKDYAQSPDFLITLAESEYDDILYDTARDDLTHAIILNQNSYQAHFLLGNVLFKMNDVDKAIAEYHLAISLAPNQPRPYYQLALALQANNDEASEESVLTQALDADDNFAPAHVEMGRVLMNQGRFSDAVVHLNLAIQENPSSEQAYFQLVRAYAELGEKDKGKEMARRLVAVRNANWRAAGDKNVSQSDAKTATSP
jgi:tetratricopeptide (TPR) repeat protein